MDSPLISAINAGFAWLIVAFSIVGYLVTIKRTGQRWSLWIPLATGWALLAVPYTLLAIGISIDESDMATIWLSSYIMVMASLSLLFLKFVEMMKHRGNSNAAGQSGKRWTHKPRGELKGGDQNE